ncbi:MAG: transposase, partial [Thiomonas sp.]
MHAIRAQQFLSRWKAVQFDLIPALQGELGAMTPKLEQLIHVLEWVRIEEFVDSTWIGIGRPPAQRAWFANAFVAKTVLGIGTTVGLMERLSVDRALRRLCGFSMHRRLPSEATFSRAFAEFAQTRLAERVHEALIKEHLGDVLIGHLSRDGTAIVARERPQAKAAKPKRCGRRGRPRAGQNPPAPPSPVAQQRQQTLAEMRHNIPTACDRGAKCNAQGYKTSWNGYKLHIDTADCGVPIAAMLSSASMHDSLAAIPLSHLSAQRVTNLYDLRASCKTPVPRLIFRIVECDLSRRGWP